MPINKEIIVVGSYMSTAPMRKECQSCFKWFDTQDRWAQRCPICKRRNSPKRKLIKNIRFNDNKEPF